MSKHSVFLLAMACVMNSGSCQAQSEEASSSLALRTILDVWNKRANDTKYLSFKLSGLVTIPPLTYSRVDPMSGEVLGHNLPREEMKVPWLNSIEILPFQRQLNWRDSFVAFNVETGVFHPHDTTYYIGTDEFEIERVDLRTVEEKQDAEHPFIQFSLNGKANNGMVDVFGVQNAILASYGHLMKTGYDRYEINDELWPVSVNASVVQQSDPNRFMLSFHDDTNQSGSSLETAIEVDSGLEYQIRNYTVFSNGKKVLEVTLDYGSAVGRAVPPISGRFSKFNFRDRTLQLTGKFEVTGFVSSADPIPVNCRAAPNPGDWCQEIPTGRIFQAEAARGIGSSVIVALISGTLLLCYGLYKVIRKVRST